MDICLEDTAAELGTIAGEPALDHVRVNPELIDQVVTGMEHKLRICEKSR